MSGGAPLPQNVDNPLFSSLHSRAVPSLETCRVAFRHDRTAEVLSSLIVVGLIVSYLPQHIRIIRNRSSEGLSPYFLLLGATGSACSLFNILSLQWGQISCCQYLSKGECFESLLGIAQVFFQWLCFNIIFVLFLMFYPRSHKFVRLLPLEASSIPAAKPWLDHIIDWIPDSMRSTTDRNRIVDPQSYQSVAARSHTARQSSQQRDTLYGGNAETARTANFLQATPARAGRSSSLSSSSSGHSNSSSGSEAALFDPRSVLLPGQVRKSTITLSPEYRLALTLFSLTILHLVLTFSTTIILVLTLPSRPPRENTPPAFPTPPDEMNKFGVESLASFVWSRSLSALGVNISAGGVGEGSSGGGREHPSERALRYWATFLGLFSVVLGCAQYLPQWVLTARSKLVGSLSIPMMILQVPGSFVFVYTLAVRPGVNWTGWATYLVTGILQGSLLGLCLVWKARQKRLGIDDWGNSLTVVGTTSSGPTSLPTPPPQHTTSNSTTNRPDESSRLLP